MTTSRRFLNRPASIAEARRFAADIVDPVAPEFTEVIVLMLSELATNCVRYGLSDFEVRIDATAAEIRVEVHDEGSGQPMMRSPAPHEASGRGLQVIDAFAHSWGVSETPDLPGKTVWFTVSPAATSSLL